MAVCSCRLQFFCKYDNSSPTIHGLPEIVRALKTFSSPKINELRQTQGASVWQRIYYEHIIRDSEDYTMIANYIMENPLRWEENKEM